jgi:ABC-type nickel/cobalt efflux system permease component RcnA
MANTDPKDEVRNIERPSNAVVQSPDTDSSADQISDHSHQVQQACKRDKETDPPALPWPRV